MITAIAVISTGPTLVLLSANAPVAAAATLPNAPAGATVTGGLQGPAGPVGPTGATGSIGPAGPAGPVPSVNGATGAVTIAATGGAVVTTTGGAITIAEPGGFLNELRNGTFDIWQRGTSALAAGATTVNAYAADGWIINATYSSGAGPVMAQAANNRTGANTLYGLQITGAANVTDVELIQRIESYQSVKMAGDASVTFQMQVYNNTGGSITPKLSTLYPTVKDNWASTSQDLAAVNLQPCPNGQWTLVAYTFPVSVNANLGYEIVVDFGNNLSAGQSVIVAEADMRVTPGVATGLNAAPPPPELRRIQIEYAICRRFYRTTYDLGTAPGTATRKGMVGGFIYTGSLYTGFSVAFDEPMRADPVIAYYDGAGALSKVTYLASGTFTDGQSTTVTIANIGMCGFHFSVTAQGSGIMDLIHYTASAEL